MKQQKNNPVQDRNNVNSRPQKDPDDAEEIVDQDPGHSQKQNQRDQKEDPLAV